MTPRCLPVGVFTIVRTWDATDKNAEIVCMAVLLIYNYQPNKSSLEFRL